MYIKWLVIYYVLHTSIGLIWQVDNLNTNLIMIQYKRTDEETRV